MAFGQWRGPDNGPSRGSKRWKRTSRSSFAGVADRMTRRSSETRFGWGRRRSTLQDGRGERLRAELAGLACQVRPSPMESCGENATVEELRDEVARLRQQIKQAELVR